MVGHGIMVVVPGERSEAASLASFLGRGLNFL